MNFLSTDRFQPHDAFFDRLFMAHQRHTLLSREYPLSGSAITLLSDYHAWALLAWCNESAGCYDDRMPDLTHFGARTSAATARNREPILGVLTPRLPKTGLVLEIAAGAGEHAVYNAAALPQLQWQPTDPDPGAFASIAAWRGHAGLRNLLPPMRLDASRPDDWPVDRADAIVTINMIHISPWVATQGLMTGAGRLLHIGDMLFLYGPFIESGIETAPSNLAFDLDLRTRNRAWGIRHLDEVTVLASRYGLELSERIDMPANNLSLIFRKT